MVLFEKNKYVRHIASFSTDWASKTTNVSAGQNFKELIGNELWSKIIKPENKNRYILKAYYSATAAGTAFQGVIDAYNILDNKSDKVYLNGGQTIKAYDFGNPATTWNIEGNLMVNHLGDVRLYIMFAGTLNSSFKCPKIDIYEVE